MRDDGGMKKWKVSDRWWRKHTSSDLVYTVVLKVMPAQVSEPVWEAISADRDVNPDGSLDFGGVSVKRDGNLFEVCSGGEDGLDSLEYGINDVVLGTLKSVDADAEWFQVKEVRELDR